MKVRWTQSALDEVANIWTQADSTIRNEITAACHVVDQRLLASPNYEGESRSHGRRIMFVPLLAVLFRPDLATNIVWVIQVRLMRKKA